MVDVEYGNTIKAEVYGANQYFWTGDIPAGVVISGISYKPFELYKERLPSFTKPFSEYSDMEVMCRRLLTDDSILLDSGDSQLVLRDLINFIRSKPIAVRKTYFKKFTGPDFIERLITALPRLEFANRSESFGDTVYLSVKRSSKQFIRDVFKMVFLLDNLSLIVIEATSPHGCGNSIDLPWNASKVIDAVNKLDYPITSIPNWMYAQAIPYVDNSLLISDGILLSLDASQRLFVINSSGTGYWRVPFSQFRPAYEQGIFMSPLSNEMVLGLGWENAVFNARMYSI